MFNSQMALLGGEEPGFDPRFASLERVPLERGAWVDYAPGWLAGHETLFEHLLRTTAWRSGEELMYDRMVATPRVFGVVPADGPGHPILEAMRRALSQRYGEEFTRVSLALYRHGRDSVAFHGDRVARNLPRALVATVSLGAPRRFLMRLRPSEPAADGGSSASVTALEPMRRSRAWNLGWGDLLVMGGSCQRTWQHGIPKVAHASPRIAVMFRPDWG